MTDRELLELAAKAAGLPELRGAGSQHHCYYVLDEQPTKWNPLTDDGDALRLAVRLKMDIRPSEEIQTIHIWSDVLDRWIEEVYGSTNDPYAATRRAITRAAAEIGKGME